MNTTLKRYYGKRRMVEVVVWWMWLQCYSDFKKGEMYSELPYMWEVYPTGLIRKSIGPIVGMQPTSKQITKTIDDNPLILSLVWQLTRWPYYMRNVNYLWKSLRIKLTESIKCFIQKKKKCRKCFMIRSFIHNGLTSQRILKRKTSMMHRIKIFLNHAWWSPQIQATHRSPSLNST